MLSKVFLAVICTLSVIGVASSSAIDLEGRGASLVPAKNLGCYSDPDFNKRTLMSATEYQGSMTPSKCGDLCKDYNYFGLENGNECWCDYNIKKNGGGGVKIAEGLCNATCYDGGQAVSGVNCGGPKALNIFQIPLVPIEPKDRLFSFNVLDNKGASSVWRYRNCYNGYDQAVGVRNLEYQYIDQKSPKRDETVQSCTTVCFGLGYIYAGLEYGRECFCGNVLRNNITSPGMCSQACTADPTTICGYYALSSVYEKVL